MTNYSSYNDQYRDHNSSNDTDYLSSLYGKNRDTINNWVKALNTSKLKFVDRMVLDINRRELLKQEVEFRNEFVETHIIEEKRVIVESNVRNSISDSYESEGQQNFNDHNDVYNRLNRDANMRKSLIKIRDKEKELIEHQILARKKTHIDKEKLKSIIDRLSSNANIKEEKYRIQREENEKAEIAESIRLANMYHQRKPNPKIMERLTEEDKIIEREYAIQNEIRRQSNRRSLSMSESKAIVDRLVRSSNIRRSSENFNDKENAKKATISEIENMISRLHKSVSSTPSKEKIIDRKSVTPKSKPRSQSTKKLSVKPTISGNYVIDKIFTPLKVAKNERNSVKNKSLNKHTNPANQISIENLNCKTPIKSFHSDLVANEADAIVENLKLKSFEIPKLNLVSNEVAIKSSGVLNFSEIKLSPIYNKSYDSISFMSGSVDWPQSKSHHKFSSIGQSDFQSIREEKENSPNRQHLRSISNYSNCQTLSNNEDYTSFESSSRACGSPLKSPECCKKSPIYSQETLYLMSTPFKSKVEQPSPSESEKTQNMLDTYRFIVGVDDNGEFLYE